MFSHITFNQMTKLLSATKRNLLNILDFEICESLLPSRPSAGFYAYDEVMLINPSKFPNISYLNLEDMYFVLQDINVVHLVCKNYEVNYNFSPEPQDRQHVLFHFFEDYVGRFLSILFKTFPRQIPMIVERYVSNISNSEDYLDMLECGDFFQSVIHVLYDFRCTDSKLVVKILKKISSKRISKACFEEIRPKFLHYILKHCIKMKFNIWGFLTNLDIPTDFCLIYNSLLTGDFTRLHILLSYGFKPREFDVNIHRRLYFNWKVVRVVVNAEIMIQVDKFLNDKNAERYSLIFEVFLVILQILQNDTKRNEWIKCINILFCSIPDPYISVRELKNLLSILVSSYGENITEKVICETLDQVLWENVAEKYSPRSLLHLCRCYIRENLRRNFQLPSGINRLQLPEKLKLYLSLES